MRETRFKVLDQGDVVMAHEAGYMVTGGDDAVCFYIDPSDGRAYVGASTESVGGCPVVFIDRDGAEKSTAIEFSEFPGWRFHSGGCGKSIAIALVRRAAEVQHLNSAAHDVAQAGIDAVKQWASQPNAPN